MKKIFSLLSTVLLVSIWIISAQTLVFADDFFQYEVLKDGTASITSYTGGKNLVIPEKLDGYTVSTISKKAFENASFKRVTIPDSVVLIDESAFYHSEITDSLTFLGPICFGKDSFRDSSLPKDLVIPAGSEIGEGAFAYTQKLETLLIGEKTVLKEDSFDHSLDLLKIMIMADTKVEKHAFRACSQTSELHIADKCTISSGAFEYNSSLKKVHAAVSAKVDKDAFSGSKPVTDTKVSIDSSLDKKKVTEEALSSPGKTSAGKKGTTDKSTQEKNEEKDDFAFSDYSLILNNNTHKFHQNTCDSVYDISPKNREGFNGTPEEAMALGFKPCQKCSAKWNAPEPAPASEIRAQAASSAGAQYIINTNTGKFHYPSCRSVKQMKDKNKQVFNGSREELINIGYDPCQNCNP